MGQSNSRPLEVYNKYPNSTWQAALRIPSLAVEVFSDHAVDRFEALDPEYYITRKIYLWPKSADGKVYVPFDFAEGHFGMLSLQTNQRAGFVQMKKGRR